MYDVIVLAAGTGERAKLGYPKQLSLLGGKPIMMHCLEMFQCMEMVDQIIVASIPHKREQFQSICQQYGITKALVVQGGSTRQESVHCALAYVGTNSVLIHEAVRPFITPELVKWMFASFVNDNTRPLVPTVPIVPTIFNLETDTYVNREILLNVQLPQLFDTTKLRTAHATACLDGQRFTDDSSLYWAITGETPRFFEGLEHNIKITTPLDLKLAEAIYYEIYSDCDGG